MGKTSNKERELNGISFAGDTLEDRKLWGTYVYWALEKARFGQTKDKTTIPAVVDNSINRIDDSLSFTLQVIIFSAFALEYRVKRVLIHMGAEFDPMGAFTSLLKAFWQRLENINRLDKKGKCLPPTEWDDCLEELLKLVGLRNDIVHANYSEVRSFFSGTEFPLRKARQYYRSFIEAMRLINKGTGYETRSDEESKKDFESLKVADEWSVKN